MARRAQRQEATTAAASSLDVSMTALGTMLEEATGHQTGGEMGP